MAAILQTMRSGGTQHPEEIIASALSLSINQSGVLSQAGNDFKVEETDTPAMSVDVKQGFAYIKNSAGDMVYPCWLNTEDDRLTITANTSGNGRIDSVVLYIDLSASPDASISNVATLAVVAGTPAASPTAPDSTAIQTAIGASNPYIVLANVTVADSESSISNTEITDKRPQVLYNTSSEAYKAYADSATIALDGSQRRKFAVTLAGNRTLTITNIRQNVFYIFKIIQDATGSRTPTFGAGFNTINWIDGSAPTWTTMASKKDIIVLECTDNTGGSEVWEGYIAGQGMAQ